MHFIAYELKGAQAHGKDLILALGDAILVCLTESPMTGYDLAKTFDASIGFFWKADHQQIYRELSRLRDRGHVQAQVVVQSGRPNKQVYSLTPAGRTALRTWACEASVAPSIKDDLMVRLYALDALDLAPICADLAARQRYHRERLARYERILERRFPEQASNLRDLGRLLGLRMGLRYERSVSEWCEEALAILERAAPAPR